ncbi:hypothetical protein BDN72DRAFT_870442 [Pluteus cervinus]|uniref:Uncharacterized protein n=1 Tax=Pluteus cervinus TaxID=181527 RepID=A0ACD3AWT5_9AGAR|nr:hypothetical protein BDN72DRAFT_870442 [Pluteus cervinus]
MNRIRVEDFGMIDLGQHNRRRGDEEDTDSGDEDKVVAEVDDDEAEDEDEVDEADGDPHMPRVVPELNVEQDQQSEVSDDAPSQFDDDDDNDDDDDDDIPVDAEKPPVKDQRRFKPFVEDYPDERAGAPLDLPDTNNEDSGSFDNPCEPFSGWMNWDFAWWAKTESLSGKAITKLLKINGLVEKLGLSYSNTAELNKFIDKNLPSPHPNFIRQEFKIDGHTYELYHRDPLECIRTLWGDRELTPHLIFRPERHYEDADCTIRIYHDMHTAKWWWATQKAVDKNSPGGTIIPLLISTDKTTLTMFGGKAAYPMYLTIANLPKEIRRKPSRHAQVLLGYLPATSLDHITCAASRRRTVANLFHACAGRIMETLKDAGKDGLNMQSGDRIWRRCHPIFATFVGDYLEQILVACVKKGECPSCPIPYNEGPTVFNQACKDAGIKPIQHPFWEELPYSHIYRSITPDILHQLYQGFIKHLVKWLRSAYGDVQLNTRCRALPPNHNIRLFFNGITHLQRVTGREHSQIASILLGLIINLPLPQQQSPRRLIRAVRAVLDFTYLSQYPVHTHATLDALDDALASFHDNKDIFVDLGIRAHFQIPKIHVIEHYSTFIQLYGTTDNYNTEYTERLHIDLAKDAYPGNGTDQLPQMTRWLERREKMVHHKATIEWRLAGQPTPVIYAKPSVGISFERFIKMAKFPSRKLVSLTTLIDTYGATNFEHALACFLVSRKQPTLPWNHVVRRARHLDLSDCTFNVFHFIKFTIMDPYHLPSYERIIDSIHSKPARRDKYNHIIPARFNTALIDRGNDLEGIHRYRVGRVRTIFTLPDDLVQEYLDDLDEVPSHFVYVDLYSPFSADPESDHDLYKIKPETRNGSPVSRVVPVDNIGRSVHLFPKLGPVVDPEWTSSNVLDQADTFFVNPFSDRDIYYTISQ